MYIYTCICTRRLNLLSICKHTSKYKKYMKMSANVEKVKIPYTCVFVRDMENKKVLLGLKKRGRGQNKWNGLGGKLESNESVAECAKRYTKINAK